jgi:hypothetical protein
MRSFEPLSVDRELRQTAERWERWHRALAAGHGFDRDPFGGERMGKTLFAEVRDLPEHDPLRGELMRWVFRFAEQRINGPWFVREAELEHVSEHPVREPVEGSFTLRAMTRAALRGQDGALWHAARERSAGGLGAHRAAFWERRHELSVRIGLPSFFALEPLVPLAVSEATALLSATDDAARELVPQGMSGFVETALARGAAEGWPARLAPDTLGPLLGHVDWLRSLPIEAPTLPDRLAPASFARALGHLGEAWARAMAPRDQPFVIARDVAGLFTHTQGALFASLVREPVYLRRQLALTGAATASHTRALSIATLCWVRLAAARCLLASWAPAGGPELIDRQAELMARLIGRELPRDTTLGLIRLRTNEAQRFAAHLLAATRREDLLSAHDEDWFRSPRAIEQVREESKLSPIKTTTPEALAQGRAHLQKSLLKALA